LHHEQLNIATTISLAPINASWLPENAAEDEETAWRALTETEFRGWVFSAVR
jgi:hypothetical protein